MAISVDTQDLINYPGTIKRVTVDQSAIVAQGNEGDESYVLSFYTSAYSDATARTTIQTLYITNFKAGWCRSSGFAGTANKFALSATCNTLGIKLDSTVSGTAGTGYYDIVLDYNTDGTPIPGDTIAADMEIKIRAIADNLVTADIGNRLAYMNASVEYTDGCFWIVSGSVGNSYAGNNKTAVAITSGSTNDASVMLGFNISVTSEYIESITVAEALLVSDYTISGTTLTVSQSLGASEGDCFVIRDSDNTVDYFQITENPTVGNLLTFSSSAIKHNYSSGLAKVQLLREQDSYGSPKLWYENIDSIVRFGIKTMVNQIDYSA